MQIYISGVDLPSLRCVRARKGGRQALRCFLPRPRTACPIPVMLLRIRMDAWLTRDFLCGAFRASAVAAASAGATVLIGVCWSNSTTAAD